MPTRKRPPLSQKLNLVKTLKYEHYAMRVLIFELVFCSGHRRKTLMKYRVQYFGTYVNLHFRQDVRLSIIISSFTCVIVVLCFYYTMHIHPPYPCHPPPQESPSPRPDLGAASSPQPPSVRLHSRFSLLLFPP